MPLNLSVIAMIALLGMMAGCGVKESNDASPSETALTEKTQEVEMNATDGVDLASNALGTPSLSEAQSSVEFVIVMLGDSLTAGYALSDDDALPSQLEKRLKDSGIAARVVNAGVSGDTTAGGLARFDWSVTSAQPDLLLVALGANDYLQGIDPARTRDNLSAIIGRAKAAGIPVALIGIESTSPDTVDQFDAAYSEIYPSLAAIHDMPLYPAMLKGVRAHPALLQGDGLHPTSQGVGIIADNLEVFLTPIIADLSE